MDIKKIIAVAIGLVTVGAVGFGIAILREFFRWIDDIYWQNADPGEHAAKGEDTGGDKE